MRNALFYRLQPSVSGPNPEDEGENATQKTAAAIGGRGNNHVLKLVLYNRNVLDKATARVLAQFRDGFLAETIE
ncbi:hypothetical protein CHH27_20885 [Labrenzia sp. VG12]|nr:hypothetical protein CHH27_20885 [Labrenzia sp. VG12]